MSTALSKTRFCRALAVIAACLLMVAMPTRADDERSSSPTQVAATPDASATESAKTPETRTAPTDAPATSATGNKPLFPSDFVKPAAGGALRPAGGSGETGTGLITSLAAPMAVVLGAICVAAAIFKKLRGSGTGLISALGAGGPAPAGLLEVIGRYPIARGHSLVVLKFDQRIMLLSHTTGGGRGRAGTPAFTVLSETAEPTEVASILLKARDAEGESISRRFETLMERFDDQAARTLDDDEPQIGRQTLASAAGRVDRAELWRDDVAAPAVTESVTPPPPHNPVVRNARVQSAVDDLQARLARMASGSMEAAR